MYGNPYPGVYPGVYNPGQNMANQPGGQSIGQPQVNNQPAGYVCRPVTSREEAVAVTVDFLGPGTIMPDFSHGMIYFKRFNPNSGGAEFFDFSVQPPPQAKQSAPIAQGYAQVTQKSINSRTRYSTVVSTSATGGTFKLLGNTCPCPTNNLRSINGTAPAAPAAPTT